MLGQIEAIEKWKSIIIDWLSSAISKDEAIFVYVEFGWLQSLRTLDQFPAWSDSLPANILVEHDVIQLRLSYLFEYPEAISAPNLWHVLKIPVAYISLSPQKRFSLFQLNIVEIVSRYVSIILLFFFLELLTRVHMVIDPFTFHHSVFISTVKVYIYTIHSTLSAILWSLYFIPQSNMTSKKKTACTPHYAPLPAPTMDGVAPTKCSCPSDFSSTV